MKINIQYFAKLREECGCSREIVETGTNNVLDLYNELKVKYRFSIETENLKVAVNDQFSSWETKLNENDLVVFIQPVAGG